MASFTTIGDTLELAIPARGETITLAISGTYDQTILFQREQGSPGSGAWVTLLTFNTEDATEAEAYTSSGDNEVVRFFLEVDGGGTATVTLTDNDNRLVRVWKDQEDNVVLQLDQDGWTSNGVHQKTNNIVSMAAATLSLTAALHAGKVVTTKQAATLTITLPAATGTGNIYTIFTGITATGDHIYEVASASDSFGGGVSISTDIAGISELAVVGDDTLTMNGTTTGGLRGSWVRFTDLGSGLWMVEGFLASSGSEATCFSAAV